MMTARYLRDRDDVITTALLCVVDCCKNLHIHKRRERIVLTKVNASRSYLVCCCPSARLIVDLRAEDRSSSRSGTTKVKKREMIKWKNNENTLFLTVQT